jgi:hypothetical protein
VSKIIHSKKFADGRMTPQEFFVKNSFPIDAKCECGRPPWAQFSVYVPLDEAKKRGMLSGLEGVESELFKLLIQLRQHKNAKPTPHVLASRAYSCKQCLPEANKQAARGPSWAFVDVIEPPKEVIHAS